MGLDIDEPGAEAEHERRLDDAAGLPDAGTYRDAVATGRVELDDALGGGRVGAVEAGQTETPDGAVTTLRGHHGSGRRRAILADGQELEVSVDVVGADRDITTGPDHLIRVVDHRQLRRPGGVGRVQVQRV